MATTLKIYPGYYGADLLVKTFFYGNGFRGEIFYNDHVVLAYDKNEVVGGAILRDKKVLIIAKKKNVRKKLHKAVTASGS